MLQEIEIKAVWPVISAGDRHLKGRPIHLGQSHGQWQNRLFALRF